MKHRPVNKYGRTDFLKGYFDARMEEIELTGVIPNMTCQLITCISDTNIPVSLRDINGLLTDLAFAPKYPRGVPIRTFEPVLTYEQFFISILFVLRRLNPDLFSRIRNRKHHSKDLSDELIDWLGFNQSEGHNRNIKLSILFYMNVEDYINEPRDQSHKYDPPRGNYDSETGIYRYLEGTTFRELETFTSPNSDDE